jgi:hypothetical protein
VRCPAVAPRQSHNREPPHDARPASGGVPRRTAT